MVIIMDFRKKLLTLLAIFCVIASAGVVCAADASADGNLGIDYADEGGWAGSQYQDDGYAGSQYQDDGGWAGSQYNESEENGGYAGSQYQDDGGWAGSQYNETAENGNATSQFGAGEPTNTTGNTTNATTSKMLATGNPILLIIGATAILGGCGVALRKR